MKQLVGQLVNSPCIAKGLFYTTSSNNNDFWFENLFIFTLILSFEAACCLASEFTFRTCGLVQSHCRYRQ